MKSAVENLDPTRVKLTVEVGYDELKSSMDHAYEHIGAQVNVPGFRKGKVPPPILEQRVGRGAIIEHAVNDAVPGLYNSAVAESGIRPMSQPKIEVTQLPNLTGKAGGELIFAAEVDVRPEFELPDFSAVELTVAGGKEISEDDVDAKLDELRAGFGTLVGVERAAQQGDFVTLDLKATIGEEEVDSASGISYEIGAGNMLEGLDEALIGLSAGESGTFTTTLAGGDHQGEEAEVAVNPTAVKERELPEADDDFAQMASEFDTIAELREDLRTQVAKDSASEQAVAARDALLEKLRADLDIPVPAGPVDEEINKHLQAEGKEAGDPHGEEVREEITTLVRDQIILDAIAEKYEVQATQNELLEYLVQAAKQYGMDPNQFIQAASQAGQIQAFMGEIVRNKSIAVALRDVSVKDEDGNELDLTEFLGTDEDDVEDAAITADEDDVDETEAAQAEETETEAAEAEDTESAEAEAEDTDKA